MVFVTKATTLVTALYDLGRGNLQKEANNHRSFDAYLDWFRHLLTIQAPLVIYIPPIGPESGGHDLQKFIQQYRPQSKDLPTIIKIIPLRDLPLAKETSRITQVMKTCNQNGSHPDRRLEFHHPPYTVMIFSKFDLLCNCIQENPFKSQYFFWIDAGYFRQAPGQELKCPWPDPDKVLAIGDKFLLQNINLVPESYGKKWDQPLDNDEKKYLQGCPNQIMACFFGGQQQIITEISHGVSYLFNAMLASKLINNEQQILSLLAMRSPDKFLLYPADKNPRSLVSDLAMGGDFKLNYPLCPHLKVFTVVTSDVNEESFQPWLETATYYGYSHQVLARNEKWLGWPFRTSKYLEAVEGLSDDVKVVILSDGTDLFFCGSAWEAYRKFKASGEDIFIGGESLIAYNQSAGHHSSYKIEEYFIRECQSRYCFPNGGFVIGRVEAIIKLLRANLDSNDDQAGYMDLGYEGKIRYKVDEKNKFVGNLPNYQGFTKRDIGFWQWDSCCYRYYNPHSGEYPIALHFPGKNQINQTRFLRQIVPRYRQLLAKTQEVSGIWLVLIIAIMIFLIYIFWRWMCYF